MNKVKNNQTNQGQTSENQTSCLKRVGNGDINVFLGEKVQEVWCHTNRKGLIDIFNTILKNIGESRHLSSKDNFDRFVSICDDIYFNLNVNLSHMIKWEECQDKTILKQKNFLLNRNIQEVFIKEIKRVKRNDYFIKFFITSNNKKFWKEIIRHFPNTEWIIDINQVVDNEFVGNNIPCESMLFYNDGNNIGCNSCESNDFDSMEDLFPVHFGLKKNVILKKDIDLNLKRFQTSNMDNYPMEVIFSNKVISVSNPLEYRELIHYKLRKSYINDYKWKGLLENLKENPEMVNVIDRFSPYYFDLLEDWKVG